MVIKLAEIVHSRLDYESTDTNGDLTLSCPDDVNSDTLFLIREGNAESGTIVDSVTVQPLVLNKINLVCDDEVVKGDTLLITAQLVPNTRGVDLSGYSLVFSGAISGTYVTDSNGQVNIYYTGQGTGTQSVTVTAGNWNATKTFDDILTYWKASSNKYIEKYTLNQGFKKLAQYYSLDSSVGNLGLLCIGDYNSVSDWQLSFRIFEKVSNIHFDICSWSGSPESINDLDISRQVSFNAGDVIVATCTNGNLVVTQNGNSLFTKSILPNQYPVLAVFSDIPTSIDINQQNTVTVRSLKFDELKLMGI